MSGFLATYLAVVPPQDDATRHWFIIAAAIIGSVTIIGIVAFAFAEYFRDRARDRRERKRDKTLKKVLAKLAAMSQVATASAPPPIEFSARESAPNVEPPPAASPAMLRQAGIDLAKEIRALLDSVPRGVSLEEEHNRLFEPFLKTYYQRLSAIKDRFETVLPKWSVVSPAEWLPNSRDNVKKIADNLEQESLKVPLDVPF